MTVRAGDIRPGKCFAVADLQSVRRVLGVKGGLVSFEARTSMLLFREWPTRAELPLSTFENEAAIEVGCDYVPGRSAERIYL